jgi:tetratricopeptide (TPR) repeat protein
MNLRKRPRCTLCRMLNFLAQSLNDLGNNAEHRGMQGPAKILYRSAATVRPSWSSPWYNLGLQAKYQGEWQASMRFNQRAASLDPDDQASWWNLGIAATALREWTQARRAWNACGIGLEEGLDEISMPPVTACVRLNPDTSAEVVWGTRVDPARIEIRSVPLPNSNRRYRDILLNDGAAEGTRKSGEQEYPVFDELAVWKPSNYSTFQSALLMTTRTLSGT